MTLNDNMKLNWPIIYFCTKNTNDWNDGICLNIILSYNINKKNNTDHFQLNLQKWYHDSFSA